MDIERETLTVHALFDDFLKRVGSNFQDKISYNVKYNKFAKAFEIETFIESESLFPQKTFAKYLETTEGKTLIEDFKKRNNVFFINYSF